MDLESFGFLLVVVKATVLLGAGLAIATALRRAPASARHGVWLATLASVLALPAMIGLTPLRIEVLPELPGRPLAAPAPRSSVVGTRPPASDVALPAQWPTASAVATTEVGSPVVSTGLWPRPTVAQVLLVVWMTVALALLARLAASLLAVRRIVATARPLHGPAWESLLCDAADRLGLADLPRLVSSERVEMPFASGLRRGTIVLPESAGDWSDERRRLVLFHELAHMKRRDLLGHLLGRVACAAYWFHPLAWTAVRRLRAESERACDDLVLACGTKPSAYAGHLLEILTSARRPGAPSAAVAMARRSEFEGRMLAILDPAASRGVPGRLRSAVLMGGLALVFLSVAALAPSRPSNASNPSNASASPENPPALQLSTPVQAEAAPRGELKRRQAERQAEREAERRAERQAERAERKNDREDEDSEEADSRPTGEEMSLLVRVLGTDTDANVRRSAAWALAAADAPAVEALATALKADADDNVREMAAWGLAEAEGERASGALAAALQGDRSDKVRATAAWALGQRQSSSRAALVAALTDQAPKVREAAIWGMGNQDLEAAPPALTAALRDAEGPVRRVAAWALSQIGDPATAPALRAAFKDEKDEEVREAVFHALMLLGDRSPAIIEQMLDAKEPELRERAIHMMSRRRGPWPWPWPRPQPRPFP